jgi:hypothetical protein
MEAATESPKWITSITEGSSVAKEKRTNGTVNSSGFSL